jgi:hypothetical protein
MLQIVPVQLRARWYSAWISVVGLKLLNPVGAHGWADVLGPTSAPPPACPILPQADRSLRVLHRAAPAQANQIGVGFVLTAQHQQCPH